MTPQEASSPTTSSERFVGTFCFESRIQARRGLADLDARVVDARW
jgi:hypothetical protein